MLNENDINTIIAALENRVSDVKESKALRDECRRLSNILGDEAIKGLEAVRV